MDLYNILNVNQDASEKDIKKAYLKLVKKYHPDKNPNYINEFRKIQTAYDILINDTSRLEYQKMDNNTKNSFVSVLENIIKNTINISKLKEYGINITENNFDYLNFFNMINVFDLLQIFKTKNIKNRYFDDFNNCSDSDTDIYDETFAEHYYSLPFFAQKYNDIDIKIDLPIKLSDLNNKKKIVLKRNINNIIETSTFVFKLNSPYVIYIGGGDIKNNDIGNLIIKLNLPNNLLWNEEMILIKQNISLYEFIYGLDISINLSDDIININNWIPYRDGYLITIDKKIGKYTLAIKLYLDYDNTNENKELLKKYFS
jgi:curved DNA-binding protein CbpA